MDPIDRSRKLSWRLFLVFVGLAFLGSFLSAVLGSSCGRCGGAGDGGRGLALLGTLYYAALLGAGILTGPSLAVFGGIQVAAGIHGVLLGILWQRGQFCPLCIGTALSAGAALVASIVHDSRNAWRGAYMIPGAALMFQTAILLGGGAPLNLTPPALVEVEKFSGQDPSSSQARPEDVRMVAFVRSDCGYCRILEEEVVPALKRDFGARLTFEPRSAESLPGMPTPTIVLSGQAGRRVFPGLPPEEDLRAAVVSVMGVRHEPSPQTLLPASR